MSASRLVGLALAVGCTTGSSGSGLEEPTDPRPGPELGVWAPDLQRPLGPVHPSLGPALRLRDALVAPTGHGVRWWWDDGSTTDIATPGWATRVVSVGECLWVADGTAGIGVICGHGTEMRYTPGPALGTVRSLANTGEHTLAAVAEGWLVLLATHADGRPDIRHRIVLDGAPMDVALRAEEGLTHWAVATQMGGLYLGTVSEDWAIEITERRHRRADWTALTPHGAYGLIGGRLTGPGFPRDGEVFSDCDGPVIATGGERLWLACGARGAVCVDPQGDAAEVVVSRPCGQAATVGRSVCVDAVGAASTETGDGAFVSWSDGRIERAECIEDQVVGPPGGESGEVSIVDSGIVAITLGDGATRVRTVEGSREVSLGAAVTDVVQGSRDLVVASSHAGAVALRPGAASHNTWMLETVTGGKVAGVATAGPVLWIADQEQGLFYIDPDGVRRSGPAFRNELGAETIASDGRRVVAASAYQGEMVAIVDDVERHLFLHGDPVSLDFVGDFVVAGMPAFGVEVVSLNGEDATGELPQRCLELPVVPPRKPFGRTCTDGKRVVQTLGEQGIAVFELDARGRPLSAQIVDTPGRARDCAPTGDPNTWLVADTTSLLEVTIPDRVGLPAAPKAGANRIWCSASR